MRYESLHNHTVISDGVQTHLEVLASAEASGFNVIAFTDHDVFPDAKVMEQLGAYGGPVTWTVGIELSCGLPEELGGTAAGNLHLLGYFCDPANKELRGYLERLTASRFIRLERQVAHVRVLGFDLTVDDCLRASGISAPGSHHVVSALKAKPANLELIERLRGEFETASKSDAAVARAYAVMMDRGPVQYPYALFMKSSSFRPMPEDTLGSAMVDFDEAVGLLRRAGGVAMLAHWYFHEDVFPRAYLGKVLAEGRIDGLETAVYNRQLGTADYSSQIQYLTDLVERYDAASVLGIDGHYADDFDLFAGSGLGPRSVGQFQKLKDRFRKQ